MRLKQVKDIDDKAKSLVFGYNKKIKSKLSECNLFQNIPFMIHALCILYYYEIDTFQIADSNYFKLSNNNKTIRRISVLGPYWKHPGGYGSIMIPSTARFNGKWTIKVNNCQKAITIGITSNPCKDKHDPLFSFVHGDDIIYSYNGYIKSSKKT